MTHQSSLPTLEWTARSGALRGLVLAARRRGTALQLRGNRLALGWVLASTGALSLGCSSVSGSNTADRRALVAANTEESAAVTPTTLGGVADTTAGAAGSSGSASTATTGAAGSSGAMTTTGATTTTDPNAASGPPQECKGPDLANGVFGTPAPADGLLVDFTTYVMPGGSWGDSSVNEITGGTSLYSGATADSITQSVTNGTLELKATISVGGYTGIVLWFTPCVNASKFSGLQFSASGSLGGGSMIIKVQTSPDYPVDVTNTKGKCPFKTDANKFNECMQPSVELTSLNAAPLTLPWSMLTGGVPEDSVDNSQLLGFELQFRCPAGGSTPCPLDVKLGTINFMP